MERRTFGKTGLTVSALGFGTAEIGFLDIDKKACETLLNGVLDAGITVIDTAECYQDSEEKIGQAIGHRRKEYLLFSKCGHKVEESHAEEWTARLVSDTLHRSLRRLKTEYLDVILLHSCSTDKLRHDELIDALMNARKKGLVRFIGYSGDADDAQFAVSMKVFDCLESSVNICDQQGLSTYLPQAHSAGLGVTAKRTLANACWKDWSKIDPFYAEYVQTYTDRLKKMKINPHDVGLDGSWVPLALRFTAFQPTVDCAIVGGTNLDHIREDIRIVEQGPLPAHILQAIQDAWKANDDGSWKGQS